MNVKKFINFLIRLFSCLLLFKLLLIIGIGRITNVNFIELEFENGFFLFQIDWFKIILCTILFYIIKKSWVISSKIVNSEAIYELSIENQIAVFKIIFLIFGSVDFLFSINVFSQKSAGNEFIEINYCNLIFSIFILLFRNRISLYLVEKINKFEIENLSKRFSFQLTTLLFYFVFYGSIHYSPVFPEYGLFFQLFFMLLILNAVPFFDLININTRIISNKHYSLQLFLWLCILYFPNLYFYYYSSIFHGKSLFLNYILLYIGLPIFLLFFSNQFLRLKQLNTVSFFLLVVGYEFLIYTIHLIYEGKNYYLHFFCAILFFSISFFSNKNKKNVLKVNDRKQISKIHTPLFLPVSIILICFFRKIDADSYFLDYQENAFNLKFLLFIHFIFGLICYILIKIYNLQSKDINLKNTNFKIFLLSIFSLIIFKHSNESFYFRSLYNINSIPFNFIELLIIPISIFLFVFTSKFCDFFVKEKL